MELPVELSNTMHKQGGRITRIHSFGHIAEQPRDGYSRDHWFFTGDVEWRDGSKSTHIEIAGYALCADDGVKEPEIAALMEIMNDYLLANGEWCDRKSKHEGWYANVRPQVRRRA